MKWLLPTTKHWNVIGNDSKACRPVRNRSASADEVLLLRPTVPLWISEKMFFSTKHIDGSNDRDGDCGRSALRFHRRKERAMSVPDREVSIPSMDSAGSVRDDGSDTYSEECSLIEPLELERLDVSSTSASPTKREYVNCSRESGFIPNRSNLKSVAISDDDMFEFDSDGTHSESTSDSSCTSPRRSPVSRGFASPVRSDVPDAGGLQGFPCDEEQDEEAFLLLDRINQLSAEFKAHREFEESNALAWLVQHAGRQGVISPDLQHNLLNNIQSGPWEEARDVLYHKCHLVPAVGRVVENTVQPPIDSASVEYFLKIVDETAPGESADARHHKLKVLKSLSDLLNRWVKIMGYERGLSEEHVALTGGSLFLAGSYRMGLHDPHSDVDAVCVVPWHITVEDFFGSFCQLLSRTDGVCQLAPVPNAYVPLISLCFRGVNLDLLFARLPMCGIESHQEIDSDHVLVGVDPSSMKSLNAPRVSSMLLCLVPKRCVFRIVLRAVRSWARRRGIYSSKLGYLGGISWAILVAFVCQMYPDANPAKVFVRFFQVLSEWRWPQPIMLNMVYDAGLGFEMWDPRQNMYDRAHIMPIITPAYPHMNSSVQVTQSTFSVIYEELWRARYLVEMAAGITQPLQCKSVQDDSCGETVNPLDTVAKATRSTSPDLWRRVFERSNFFIRYRFYLVFDFNASTAASMHVWGKFVQSRLRKLVDSLQHVDMVSKVHAYPVYYPTTSRGASPGSCMFIGFELKRKGSRTTASQPTDESNVSIDDPEVNNNLMRTVKFFVATDLQQLADKQPDMEASARVCRWEELPTFVFEDGREQARLDREKYLEDLVRMARPHNRPAQGANLHFSHSGGGFRGRWRGPGSGRRSQYQHRSRPRRDERFQNWSVNKIG